MAEVLNQVNIENVGNVGNVGKTVDDDRDADTDAVTANAVANAATATATVAGKEERVEEVIELLSTSTDKKTDAQTKDLKSRDAYFAALSFWARNANAAQHAMCHFPMYMYTQFPQMFQPQLGMAPSIPIQLNSTMPMTIILNNLTTNHRQVNPIPIAAHMEARMNANPNGNDGASNQAGRNLFGGLNQRAQAEFISRYGGFEYVMASFWKRFAAEMIDTSILVVIKVILVYYLMQFLDISWDYEIPMENYEKRIFPCFFCIFVEILLFSSDFLILEYSCKMASCLYETFWLTFNNGATPGKIVMNIKVISCDAFQIVQQNGQPTQQANQRRVRRRQRQMLPFMNFFLTPRPKVKALIYPGNNVGFFRALFRSVFKALFTTVLFPITLMISSFRHNRPAYDIVARTVVVENDPSPPLIHRINRRND